MSEHDESCEADWGPEGQESPCRCGEKPTSIMRGLVSDGQFKPTSDWEKL